MDNNEEEPAKKRMRLQPCPQKWWERLGIMRCWWGYQRYQHLFQKIYGIKFSVPFHGVDTFVFRHILKYVDLAENFDKDAQRKRYPHLFQKIYGIKFSVAFHGVDNCVFRHILTYVDLAENFDKDAQRKQIEDGDDY